MRTTNRMKIGAILTLAGALIFSGAPAFAGGWGGGGSGAGGSYTCTGGEIPSGTYKNVTVSGPCTVGNGAVLTITGNVTVGKGAMLDAQSAPATITIAKNVTALPGAFLGLGCQPPALTGNSAHPCTVNPDGHSNISVNGNVTTAGTTTVLLNGITIARNVTLIGGGGTGAGVIGDRPEYRRHSSPRARQHRLSVESRICEFYHIGRQTALLG